MKVIKNASGKTSIKITEKEWIRIGEKAGWSDDIPQTQASSVPKIIKQANGKFALKMSKNEWVRMGKEAGWWDNVKQVGKGIGQGVAGAWNAGVGAAGLLGNLISSISNGIKNIREKIQQGQVQPQDVQYIRQMQSDISQTLQEAERELEEIEKRKQQGMQGGQIGQPQPGI